MTSKNIVILFKKALENNAILIDIVNHDWKKLEYIYSVE